MTGNEICKARYIMVGSVIKKSGQFTLLSNNKNLTEFQELRLQM